MKVLTVLCIPSQNSQVHFKELQDVPDHFETLCIKELTGSDAAQKLQIRSHLLKKSFMENFIFCAVIILMILWLVFQLPACISQHMLHINMLTPLDM